ncbi:Protein of unknown function [Pyronema omphalodes CBS 100304]|uniref:Uncharacterized protein n=1 Tax=Pyronema omphalodes (strain CBS 100304) TaxID=1076935 RepID=U4LRY1_PYROM|nr:Protein of unknown function [Pyronema omphalodes CBS 100304]
MGPVVYCRRYLATKLQGNICGVGCRMTKC